MNIMLSSMIIMLRGMIILPSGMIIMIRGMIINTLNIIKAKRIKLVQNFARRKINDRSKLHRIEWRTKKIILKSRIYRN